MVQSLVKSERGREGRKLFFPDARQLKAQGVPLKRVSVQQPGPCRKGIVDEVFVGQTGKNIFFSRDIAPSLPENFRPLIAQPHDLVKG
jgi:hypothetical protein